MDRKLHHQHLGCCYIAAEAQYLLNNHQLALKILEAEETDKLIEINNFQQVNNQERPHTCIGLIINSDPL